MMNKYYGFCQFDDVTMQDVVFIFNNEEEAKKFYRARCSFSSYFGLICKDTLEELVACWPDCPVVYNRLHKKYILITWGEEVGYGMYSFPLIQEAREFVETLDPYTYTEQELYLVDANFPEIKASIDNIRQGAKVW